MTTLVERLISQCSPRKQNFNDLDVARLQKRLANYKTDNILYFAMLFSWYNRDTIMDLTPENIIRLINQIIDIYENPTYQKTNILFISNLQANIKVWNNIKYVFFGNRFFVYSNGQRVLDEKHYYQFNQWIQSHPDNFRLYNGSHAVYINEENDYKPIYVHNYDIITFPYIQPGYVELYCPTCKSTKYISIMQFLNNLIQYHVTERQARCYNCGDTLPFIGTYGPQQVLYGGGPYDTDGKINVFKNIGQFYEYISYNIYDLLNCDRDNGDDIIKLNYGGILEAYIRYINEILGNNIQPAQQIDELQKDFNRYCDGQRYFVVDTICFNQSSMVNRFNVIPKNGANVDFQRFVEIYSDNNVDGNSIQRYKQCLTYIINDLQTEPQTDDMIKLNIGDKITDDGVLKEQNGNGHVYKYNPYMLNNQAYRQFYFLTNTDNQLISFALLHGQMYFNVSTNGQRQQVITILQNIRDNNDKLEKFIKLNLLCLYFWTNNHNLNFNDYPAYKLLYPIFYLTLLNFQDTKTKYLENPQQWKGKMNLPKKIVTTNYGTREHYLIPEPNWQYPKPAKQYIPKFKNKVIAEYVANRSKIILSCYKQYYKLNVPFTDCEVLISILINLYLMDDEKILNKHSRNKLKPLLDIVGARLNDENSLTKKMHDAYTNCGKIAVVKKTPNIPQLDKTQDKRQTGIDPSKWPTLDASTFKNFNKKRPQGKRK